MRTKFYCTAASAVLLLALSTCASGSDPAAPIGLGAGRIR